MPENKKERWKYVPIKGTNEIRAYYNFQKEFA